MLLTAVPKWAATKSMPELLNFGRRFHKLFKGWVGGVSIWHSVHINEWIRLGLESNMNVFYVLIVMSRLATLVGELSF